MWVIESLTGGIRRRCALPGVSIGFTAGVVVIVPSLYLLYLGYPAFEPLTAASSLLILQGVLMFAVVIYSKEPSPKVLPYSAQHEFRRQEDCPPPPLTSPFWPLAARDCLLPDAASEHNARR